MYCILQSMCLRFNADGAVGGGVGGAADGVGGVGCRCCFVGRFGGVDFLEFLLLYNFR